MVRVCRSLEGYIGLASSGWHGGGINVGASLECSLGVM